MTNGSIPHRDRTPIFLYGDSYRTPNIYYLSHFLAPDPFIFVRSEEADTVVVSPLEKDRADKEARVSRVLSYRDFDYDRFLQETGDRTEAMARLMAAVLDGGGGEEFRVEATFPVFFADRLRERGFQLLPDSDLLVAERRHKSQGEIEALARSQARAEEAIRQAAEILAESEVRDQTLVYRGVPLTSERLRAELAVSFARDGFASESMIIAPGPGSSDPHWTGAGLIKPGEPLILDIFPLDQESRYFGDVTRTYVKGEPDPRLQRMFEAVRRAQTRALEMVGPGVNGREVHETVVETFKEEGFDDDSSAKYIHGTGHGLGLEVHELPSLGKIDFELLPGDVVTVEPGLYDPEVGGVRLEDVVVIEEDGIRNLNALPKDMVIP
ncbi:MAG TPA: Xaa-Pro peptidase family protein [Chloroflexota bacterium]|nr:Xaa-Pro peptidase family protein [Chloroflexota bacterium]